MLISRTIAWVRDAYAAALRRAAQRRRRWVHTVPMGLRVRTPVLYRPERRVLSLQVLGRRTKNTRRVRITHLTQHYAP